MLAALVVAAAFCRREVMAWIIGIDEAGYGPNLGPLVVAASVWRLPDDRLGDDLYPLAAPAVTPMPAQGARGRRLRGGEEAALRPVLIADSKLVYSRSGGLEELERGVLTALEACGERPKTIADLWRAVHVEQWRPPECFVLDASASVPQAPFGGELAQLGAWLVETLSRTGIELCAIRVRAAYPDEFNGHLRVHGNKAEVLQFLFFRLLVGLEPWMQHGPGLVVCDRHGGRTRYAAIAQQIAGDCPVRVLYERSQASAYRWEGMGGRVELRFETKGERHLPVALASMAAKYLRELAMREFNAWWLRHLPGLLPTAGYPGDAGRFMKCIAPLLAPLGIERSELWRER